MSVNIQEWPSTISKGSSQDHATYLQKITYLTLEISYSVTLTFGQQIDSNSIHMRQTVKLVISNT